MMPSMSVSSRQEGLSFGGGSSNGDRGSLLLGFEASELPPITRRPEDHWSVAAASMHKRNRSPCFPEIDPKVLKNWSQGACLFRDMDERTSMQRFANLDLKPDKH